MLNKEMLNKLKEEGHVHIYHGRVFRNLKTGEIEILSKKEFKTEIKENRKVEDDWRIESIGGFTSVSLKTHVGDTVIGKHNIPANTQFNRKVSIKKALGKTLGELSRLKKRQSTEDVVTALVKN